MGFKGRIAFAMLALCACFATPSIAAPPSHVFSTSARSDELRPAAVARVATADIVAIAANERTGDERPAVVPVMYSATLIVGFGYAAALGAAAPIDPGRAPRIA